MPALREQILEVWHKILAVDAALGQYTNRPSPPPEMNPPATANDLRALEHHLHVEMPPSYREFLLLHNGGKNFLHTMPLLSTNEIMGKTPGWVEELAEESPELSHFYIAGSDETNAGYIVFDPRVVSAGGEMEAVHLTLRLLETRWPSFLEMMEARLRGSEQALAEARADRAQLED